MEGKYNWIRCQYKGKKILVRQAAPQSQVFLDEKMYTYTLDELDFTQVDNGLLQFQESIKKSNEESERMQQQMREMLASMDAKAIADHQAEIDKRKYWRELRGNVFLAIHNDYSSYSNALISTDDIIKQLYEQDEEFFKDK